MGKNKVLNLSTTKVETHCDLSSNRKRKRKRAKETVRPGKARKAPVFGQTNMGRVCFPRILGRCWSQTLESKCCSNRLHWLATSPNTVQHRPTMLDGWCFNRLAGPLS